MKNITGLFIIGFALVASLTSCDKASNSGIANSEFKHYEWEEQGWRSKNSFHFISDINYSATEVPLQYYLLKNLKGDRVKVDSVYNTLAKERIIEIEFQHAEQTDLLEEQYTRKSYRDGVEYMAFKIDKDFKVVTSSNDTIICSGVNFERNFKVAPFKRILLHFNGIDPEDTIQLIYEDQLFGNGIIKFSFDSAPLKL